MLRAFLMISVVLLGSVVDVRTQQASSPLLSDSAKTAAIESLLELEVRNRYSPPDFDDISYVSSENIEFIDGARLADHGFALVPASQLSDLQNHDVVKFLLFKSISVTDNAIDITVSHVRGGQTCFGISFGCTHFSIPT